MNLNSLFAVIGLIAVLSVPSANAQQSPAAGIEQLTQWTMEDIAHQRAKVREQDAAEEARRNLPDLSQYGTPVDISPSRRMRSSRDVHCTTINMGGGDSATDCF